jgi:hypothetical protein
MKKNSDPNGKVIEYELNKPQMFLQLVWAAIMYLLWARGTGKTVGGIAPWMVRVAEAMPGHLSGIFGKTYTHLDNNIMPKILLGLNNVGFRRDHDFVVGVKPPEHWDKCLYPIKDYKRTLTWRNGTTWQQVSLHEKGSPNAFDFQSGIFDECKYMDQAQLEDEVFPTFRGFDNLFGHKSEYLSKIFCTDKLQEYHLLKWILDKRQEVDPNRVETVINLQLKVNELEAAMEGATATQRKQLNILIRRIQIKLNQLRKGMVYVSEAKARDNIKNLGKAWFKDKINGMSKYEFDVAIENNDPIQAKDGFYPDLSDKNQYEELYPGFDCVPTIPFIIAMDYQHSVAPMCVAQIAELPGNTFKSLNFVNEFYTLAPHNLRECVDLFCAHYRSHPCKRVYFVYDQTAIGVRPTAEPVFQIVIKQFKKHGWNVINTYMGDNPEHYDKYVNINMWLREAGKWLPVYFNSTRCPKTIKSMQTAGTKIVDGKTKKDKEYENVRNYPTVDQSETTHFSDTADMTLWAVNKKKLIPISGISRGNKVAIR